MGADLVVGSLIKNPGGGLAPIGGYVAGKEELIENCAYRLTSPGLGKEVGASLGVMPVSYTHLCLGNFCRRISDLLVIRRRKARISCFIKFSLFSKNKKCYNEM